MQLTAVVEKEEKFYVARIPEIGVTSQGKTFEEAIKNVKEAAELHLEDPYVRKQLKFKLKTAKKRNQPIFTLIDVFPRDY